MVLPLVAAGIGADYLFNDGKVTKAAGDFVGEQVDDFMNAGKNRFNQQGYPDLGAAQWGGPGGSQWYEELGGQGLAGTQAGANWAQQEMMRDRGPQAWENQQLSDLEATSRGYHQEGALNFALQGMQGNQPSEAAYMLQGGLDRAIAGQQAMAGGARGAGALATAQANMAGNAAALQNQAFTQAGQLRAGEIANYAGMYGNLAGQQRQQDQGRLGMGNQMSQFNSQANDAYRMGMAGASNQFGQQGLGWYQGMAHGNDQQAQYDNAYADRRSQEHGQSQALEAGVEESKANARAANRDMIVKGAGTLLTTAGGGGGLGGS